MKQNPVHILAAECVELARKQQGERIFTLGVNTRPISWIPSGIPFFLSFGCVGFGFELGPVRSALRDAGIATRGEFAIRVPLYC